MPMSDVPRAQRSRRRRAAHSVTYELPTKALISSAIIIATEHPHKL